MSVRYLVTTPNPDFAERVMGVQFSKGRATVDEYSIDPSLGYGVEDIARRLEKDFGYAVEKIGEETPPEKKSKP